MGTSCGSKYKYCHTLELCKMIFQTGKGKRATGAICYSEKDHSIQTLPVPLHAGSILINDVELLLGAKGEVIGVSGYCPQEGWNKCAIQYPFAEPGVVFCFEALDPNGISVRFNRSKRWQIFHNPNRGVLCICEGKPLKTRQIVEVLEGVALDLDEGSLRAVWIQLMNLS
jgi:hypothetical protein